MATNRVRITDVSPRDGLQNEPGVIPTADKARLVELLAGSGVDEIEVSSFVSPRWVPQLGDAAEVLALVDRACGKAPGIAARPGARLPVFSVLAPNDKGLEGALEVNRRAGRSLIQKVSVFSAASETFSRKNTNASIGETIQRFVPVVRGAHEAGLLVRGYISCIISCPFEGPIPPQAVVRVGESLLAIGVDELDLGDTIGAGTPETVRAMLAAVGSVAPLSGSRVPVTLHLHDTFGHASECVRAALAMGVRSFDGSVAGLGGCPYASTPGKRAPGNISTELLVRTIRGAGLETGVDDAALGAAAAFASEIVAKARGVA